MKPAHEGRVCTSCGQPLLHHLSRRETCHDCRAAAKRREAAAAELHAWKGYSAGLRGTAEYR